MTVLEFEAWVSDHYDDLVGLAAVLCRSNRQTASDVLHEVIEHVLELPERVAEVSNPMAWCNRAITLRFYGNTRNAQTAARRTAAFGADAEALGLDDAYADASRIKRTNIQRNGYARNRGVPTKLGVNLSEIEWDGPIPGAVRWRFQTLRDDRLFTKAALRSHHDSMLAAVKRQVHGLERGYSYTEFGREEIAR